MDLFEKKYGIIFRWNNIGLTNMLIFNLAIFALSTVFLIITSKRLIRKRGARLIVLCLDFVMLWLLLMFLGIKAWNMSYYDYEIYHSQNEINEFVVVNKSFLHDINHWIYTRENSFFIEPVTTLPFFDYEGYNGWNENDYQVSWSDDYNATILEVSSSQSITIKW